MNLSEHFTLEELIASQTAVRLGLDNNPSQPVVDALRLVAGKLENVRSLLKSPIIISSGYRSDDLNRIVRGSKNSLHRTGQAVDFTCPMFGSPYDVCRALEQSGMVVDQVIHEYGQWVHLSFKNDSTDRREFLTLCNSKQGYRRGVFKCGP